jgi:hypothetical protein
MQRGWLKPILATPSFAALLLLAAPLHATTRSEPCDADVTASISGVGAAATQATRDRLTIVLVGDTGFNATDAPVEPGGIRGKDRTLLSFADTLSGVASEIDGDIAFANLETVFTARNDLIPDSKGQTAPFHFRSHPLALKALTNDGFNLFSLANNHSMDYGARGLDETLKSMAAANAGGTIGYAGIGHDFEEATRPACLDVDGTKIAFAATGIVTGQRPEHRAGPHKPGQTEYRDPVDFKAVVNRLASTEADYRILSIHYGLEGRVVPDDRQLADWRGLAAREKGINLVVGHHPHVAQGVELDGASLIFYGLGNFMHPGTAEMTRFGLCRDYGLMAKVHLARDNEGWRVAAIEAVPLTKTHVRPEPFPPQEGAKRIYALNLLAAGLDDGKGATGVRFTPRQDGSGLYCAPDAASLGGDLGALCTGWTPAPPAPKALAAQLAVACQDKPFYGAPGNAPRRKPSGFNGFNPF